MTDQHYNDEVDCRHDLARSAPFAICYDPLLSNLDPIFTID